MKDYSYRVLDKKNIQIYYYYLTKQRIDIPKQIRFKKVTNLDCDVNYNKFEHVPLYFQGDLKQWCELSAISEKLSVIISELYIKGKLIEGELVIPDGVTCINDRVFAFSDKITSVVISDSVKYIGEKAFSYCKNLKKVIIGKNVTKIGASAFEYCDNLESVVFEEGSELSELGGYAFFGCSKLKTIKIPDKVRTINRCTFNACKNLNNISLPSYLNHIGDYAFFECTKLKKITLPDYVYDIGDFAFQVAGLESIKFNDKLKKIGVNCFLDTNIDEMIIPNSVISIGTHCFSHLTKSINIPKGVKRLSALTREDGQLEKIVFEDGCMIKFFNRNAFLGLENIKIIITGDIVSRCMAKAFVEYGLAYRKDTMILDKYLNALEKKDLVEYINMAKEDDYVIALNILVAHYSKRYGKISKMRL